MCCRNSCMFSIVARKTLWSPMALYFLSSQLSDAFGGKLSLEICVFTSPLIPRTNTPGNEYNRSHSFFWNGMIPKAIHTCVVWVNMFLFVWWTVRLSDWVNWHSRCGRQVFACVPMTKQSAVGEYNKLLLHSTSPKNTNTHIRRHTQRLFRHTLNGNCSTLFTLLLVFHCVSGQR